MERSEAPEKIYLYPYSTDGIYEVETKPLEGTIEYTRTNAFLKKASFWLECNLSDRHMEDRKFWVEDFVNCMKGG